MCNTLSYDKYKLFLDLYFPLLLYANSKMNIVKNINSLEEFKKLDINDKYKIRNALYDNVSIFSDFIKENPFNFKSNEINIVESWNKHHIKGSFILLKYLKKYNLFYDNNAELLYGVLNINDPFESLFGNTLPVIVHTILLPFDNSIIYDGLLSYDDIHFGSGIKSQIRELTEISKLEHGIITSLPYNTIANTSAKEKLDFYLRDKKSRLYYKDSIEKLISNDDELKSYYFQFMGKVHSKDIQKKLKIYSITEAYFAIILDTVICSAKTRDELEKAIASLIPNINEDLVYVFHYKGVRKTPTKTT